MVAVYRALRGRFEAPIDGVARSKKFSDKFTFLVAPENDPVFSNTQTPKPSKLGSERTHVPLFAASHVIEGPANVPSDSRMQNFEGRNDLI